MCVLTASWNQQKHTVRPEVLCIVVGPLSCQWNLISHFENERAASVYHLLTHCLKVSVVWWCHCRLSHYLTDCRHSVVSHHFVRSDLCPLTPTRHFPPHACCPNLCLEPFLCQAFEMVVIPAYQQFANTADLQPVWHQDPGQVQSHFSLRATSVWCSLWATASYPHTSLPKYIELLPCDWLIWATCEHLPKCCYEWRITTSVYILALYLFLCSFCICLFYYVM